MQFRVLDGLLAMLGPGEEPEAGQLVALFLEQCSIQLEALRTAIAKRDCDTICRATHRLRGSCASVGAVALAEATMRIEMAARQPAPSRLEDTLSELTEVAKQTFEALRAYCAERALPLDAAPT